MNANEVHPSIADPDLDRPRIVHWFHASCEVSPRIALCGHVQRMSFDTSTSRPYQICVVCDDIHDQPPCYCPACRGLVKA